jgi:hypothetical protein
LPQISTGASRHGVFDDSNLPPNSTYADVQTGTTINQGHWCAIAVDLEAARLVFIAFSLFLFPISREFHFSTIDATTAVTLFRTMASDRARRISRSDEQQEDVQQATTLAFTCNEEPTEDELVDEIASRSFMTMKEKKEKLLPVVAALRVLAPRLPTEELVRILPTESELRLDKQNSILAKVFAKKVVLLHSSLQSFLASTAYKQQKWTREAQQALDNAQDGLCFFLQAARCNINNAKDTTVKSMIVTLKPHEQNQLYLQQGFLPVDPALCICVRCKHSFVDFPNSSKLVAQRNMAAMERFHTKKQEHEHDKAEALRKKEPFSKHVPRAPTLEERILVCHCWQNYCNGIPDGAGNKCPIRCRDEDGRPYGVHPVTRTCLCPLCMCSCSFAVKVRTCALILFANS